MGYWKDDQQSNKQEGNYAQKVISEPPLCMGCSPQVDDYTKARSENCCVWSPSGISLPCTIMIEPESQRCYRGGTTVTYGWCDLEPVALFFLPLWGPISKTGVMVPFLAPHRVVINISQIEKHLLMYYYYSLAIVLPKNFLKKIQSHWFIQEPHPKYVRVKFSEKMFKWTELEQIRLKATVWK